MNRVVGGGSEVGDGDGESASNSSSSYSSTATPDDAAAVGKVVNAGGGGFMVGRTIAVCADVVESVANTCDFLVSGNALAAERAANGGCAAPEPFAAAAACAACCFFSEMIFFSVTMIGVNLAVGAAVEPPAVTTSVSIFFS